MQAESDIFLGWAAPPVRTGWTATSMNERDYAALKAAVKDGRAQATTEI